MAQQREKFVKGAIKKGHSEAISQSVFDLMAEFAKYGFNKSHSAAYAMISICNGIGFEIKKRYLTAEVKEETPEGCN